MSIPAQGTRLGRGLVALMGEAAGQAPAAVPEPIRAGIDQLEPSPYQPRTTMAEEPLEELAESVRAHGILQPILVRPHPTEPGRYQIIAGERRWRAAALAGLHDVPIHLRDMSDRDAAAAALVENLQRSDLNPLEEAEGLQRLVADFGFTHEAMGYAIGKSRSHITNMLRLLQLPDRVKDYVRDGSLSFGHARALVSHPAIEAAAAKVVARGMSVRQTEALVARDSTSRPPRKQRAADADSEAMESELAERLGVHVSIVADNDGKGRLIIHYDSWERLEEIRQKLLRAD